MSEKNEDKNEPIVGLYIAGLLAVLVSYQLSSKLDPATNSFFSLILFMWGIYSSFMIFIYSDFSRILNYLSRILKYPKLKSNFEELKDALKTDSQVLLMFSFITSVIFILWSVWYVILLAVLITGFGVVVYYITRALWRRWRTS